jgi:hypothetical protein
MQARLLAIEELTRKACPDQLEIMVSLTRILLQLLSACDQFKILEMYAAGVLNSSLANDNLALRSNKGTDRVHTVGTNSRTPKLIKLKQSTSRRLIDTAGCGRALDMLSQELSTVLHSQQIGLTDTGDCEKGPPIQAKPARPVRSVIAGDYLR